jgi:RNA polymerase sigma factor (sigma-70 family)
MHESGSKMTVKDYNKAVEDYSNGIYRFILKNIKDQDKAQDVVQDTFEKCWIKHETVDAAKVKAYLFSTAYHTMIDMIRKESRQVDFNEIRYETLACENQYSDLNEILHKAILLLPDAQRSVILLRDYEGYTYEEIAEITGLSESQVKVYIYRGRIFLKNYIGSPEKVI